MVAAPASIVDLFVFRFYFKVKGMMKGQTYKLNIVNFTKGESLYKQVLTRLSWYDMQ